MRPFSRDFLRVIQSHFTDCRIVHHNHSKGHMTSFGPASVALEPKIPIYGRATGTTFLQQPTSHLKGNLFPSIFKSVSFSLAKLGMVYPTVPVRCLTTTGNLEESITVDSSAATTVDVAPRIKFKRLSKTAKHIMQILDKEAVQEVRERREIPDIRPGYIIQLKVEVPENKRRVSMLKGIVIARRNAGLNTTFRLRRMVAGVGVESVFPLYSPNIKEVKVLDKKKVRRAKLYYLRDKMNALNK